MDISPSNQTHNLSIVQIDTAEEINMNKSTDDGKIGSGTFLILVWHHVNKLYLLYPTQVTTQMIYVERITNYQRRLKDINQMDFN